MPHKLASVCCLSLSAVYGEFTLVISNFHGLTPSFKVTSSAGLIIRPTDAHVVYARPIISALQIVFCHEDDSPLSILSP